jgi:hypothetical protein
LIIGLGLRVIPILAISGGNLNQEIHWMIFGFDRVWYHNRTYLAPSRDFTPEEIKKLHYLKGQKFIATGEKVIGLPVYDTQLSQTFQLKQNGVSTLLFLKKSNGNFIVYTLSGGP